MVSAPMLLGLMEMAVAASPALNFDYANQSGAESRRFFPRSNGEELRVSISHPKYL